MRELADSPTGKVLLAIVLLVTLLMGAQALADASAPAGGVAATGRLIGQTGFAYLGGLRTFAAAVLWNRLDPIFDGYYGGFDSSFGVFLPSMRLVQMLDPQFQQSYYVTSFWLERTHHTEQALALAQEGLRNNPQSGFMRANLVQVLLIQDKKRNLPRMLQLSREGVGPNATWDNVDDQFEGYGTFAVVFDLAGDKTTFAAIRRAQRILKNNGAAPGVSIDSTSLPTPTFKK